MLRPYQQEAHDEIIKWVRKTREPSVIEAATGAGKSHIIAELATSIHRISGGKHVLCLAPSKELVEQNHAKFVATGNPASIFSASVGIKNLDHPVVFGTPMSVKNSIDRFGEEFAMVIIDEAHGLTPTVFKIIEEIAAKNQNLRVVGMTATPYRLGSGYIFKSWANGKEAGKSGWFARCVYRITAHELIAQKFLTPPVIGDINADGYKTKHMELNAIGKFSAEDVDRAYHGHGRKTALIIEDIVNHSADRRGVLIFAASVKHAEECLASLPPELSAMVTGETRKRDREHILREFKAQRIKYIVNVAVLTTGFDATHVDVIAMLRATESAGLLQQIVGRGLRLHDGKADCLVLDYAENLERHCPDGDIFNPEIKEREQKVGEEIECVCPMCQVPNVFSGRPNPDGHGRNEAGYFVDLDGVPLQGPYGPIPAHFGRRCTATHLRGGLLERCEYRWTSKDCPQCGHQNDIAARRCEACNQELVDPNEKLKIAFRSKKKDPTIRQCEAVVGWKIQETMSQKGSEMFRISVVTPNRSFAFWVHKKPTFPKAQKLKRMFDMLQGQPPKSIEYKKDFESGFYNVFAFNGAPDEIPA